MLHRACHRVLAEVYRRWVGFPPDRLAAFLPEDPPAVLLPGVLQELQWACLRAFRELGHPEFLQESLEECSPESLEGCSPEWREGSRKEAWELRRRADCLEGLLPALV